MNRKTQEIFFENSVDMDAITNYVNKLVDGIKEAGQPKRVEIEIRHLDKSEQKMSLEEIFQKIDEEYFKKSPNEINLQRVWKHKDLIVITGVEL